MSRQESLSSFVGWCGKRVTGDEKGQAQIFLDRLFQSFGQAGSLDVGGSAEFRIRNADENGGGTAFADYVWKPVVPVGMKKFWAVPEFSAKRNNPLPNLSQNSSRDF